MFVEKVKQIAPYVMLLDFVHQTRAHNTMFCLYLLNMQKLI